MAGRAIPPSVLTCQTKPADPWAPARVQFRPDRPLNREFVPVVVVAALVVAAIFFWRKRKQRKNEEEQRRKEMEDYGYNPNNDPTIPAVGGVSGSPGCNCSLGMCEETRFLCVPTIEVDVQ